MTFQIALQVPNHLARTQKHINIGRNRKKVLLINWRSSRKLSYRTERLRTDKVIYGGVVSHVKNLIIISIRFYFMNLLELKTVFL